MKRLAVVGAGEIARVRAKALLATGDVEICGVASRHLATAEPFAKEVGCGDWFDDYRRLEDIRPDAVVIAVPHGVQDTVVSWALDLGVHVFICGVLATTSEFAETIRETAERKRLVVEAGFQLRYSALLETVQQLVQAGDLGRPVFVRSLALWAGDTRSWYFEQEASGGMPLTHMPYCFLNPVRWILGEPRSVSALSNRVLRTEPGMNREETCVANWLFAGDVLYSQTAGFVAPDEFPAWSLAFVGTEGAVEAFPAEGPGGGTLMVYRGGEAERKTFESAGDAFEEQAGTFVRALDGPNACRNPPADTIGDIIAVEAAVRSAQGGGTSQVPGKTAS